LETGQNGYVISYNAVHCYWQWKGMLILAASAIGGSEYVNKTLIYMSKKVICQQAFCSNVCWKFVCVCTSTTSK